MWKGHLKIANNVSHTRGRVCVNMYKLEKKVKFKKSEIQSVVLK